MKDYLKEFNSLLQNLDRSKTVSTVFEDFLSLSTYALAQPFYRNKEFEKSYLEIVNRYTKEQAEKFSQMLALIVVALDDEYQDFLGKVFSLNCFGNARKGQFFTPYHVSKMMAQINCTELEENLNQNNIITLAEPCCGSGGSHQLPILHKSTKTGKEVAKELLDNLIECWGDNIELPMLTLGHMVMSIFYDDFIKKLGAPTLILYGDSGTGKSTLVVVGLAMFGLPKEALTSGGSTAKSNEYFCSKYNCLNVCIDDVKGETLKSSTFEALIKAIYKGVPRTRMLPYGKGVEHIHTCSPLSYSTNKDLPDLREVANRINEIEIIGKKFTPENFKYHEFSRENENNLKELSLILPEFLRYSKDDIIKLYEQVFEILESCVQDTQRRIINNVAYAYTGALMLSYIADVKIENLQEKVIEYTKKQIEKYENITTPVEKLLRHIATLYNIGNEPCRDHFRIMREETENGKKMQIRFPKSIMIEIINKHFSYDKEKQISKKAFTAFAKDDPRYRGTMTVNYPKLANKRMHSVCFNIEGIDGFEEFDERLGVMTAEEFKNSRNNNETEGNPM